MIELKQIEHQLIKDTNFLVVDVETTGLSADRDRITEIAFVNVRNGKITDEFYGIGRIQDTLIKYKNLHSKEIANALTQDAISFCNGAPVYDDVTLIVAKGT